MSSSPLSCGNLSLGAAVTLFYTALKFVSLVIVIQIEGQSSHSKP